jgi:hypothetical protein
LRPQSSQGKCLKAWVELSSAEKGGSKRVSYGGRSTSADKALGLFEEVLVENEKDLEAMLGRVKCWEVKRDYNRALEQINQVRQAVWSPFVEIALCIQKGLESMLGWVKCCEVKNDDTFEQINQVRQAAWRPVFAV